MSNEPLGIVAEAIRRRIELQARLAKRPAPQPIVFNPIFENGRYIPRSLKDLIGLVATHSGLTREAICGNSHRRKLVDARSCIANLAEEFAPHQSMRAVEDAMLRGAGLCAWYRDRHSDRIAQFPEYAALYERCRSYLVAS